MSVRAARTAGAVARPALAWPVAMAGLCLMLALLGAIDSYSIPLSTRLLFWGALFAVATLFAVGIEAALLRAGVSPGPVWRWWLVLSLLLAAAMTPVAYFANSSSGWAPLSMLPDHFVNSLVISLAVVGARIAIGIAASLDPGEQAPDARPALLDRLDRPVGERIVALEAEGHYVRVHGEAGSTLVLMRLKDAIREVGPTAGMQVHRGWWVAADAVERLDREEGRLFVVMGAGSALRVPVSRARRDAVQNAGWR